MHQSTSPRAIRGGAQLGTEQGGQRRPMSAAALSRPQEPLDTTVRLATPERILFQYPLAGPFRRYSSYLIDVIVVFAAVIIVAILLLILSFGSTSGVGPIFVAYFVIMWGYRGACELFFNGQTLGKRAFGIRVVSDRGVPITATQAVLRNLVGALDGTVPYLLRPDLTGMLLLFGLTSMLLTRRFQRIGDLAAGTMVVFEGVRGRAGVDRVDEPEVAAVLPWLPLRIAAGPELARALSDYVKRRNRFGAARREEMAEHLARPLRARYQLPRDSSADAVICAVYHRVFLGD
jgi:uncharacterized RDD family membrane protein YckC